MRKSFFILLCFVSAVYANKLSAQDYPEDGQPLVEERTAVNFYGSVLVEPHLFNQKLGVNMGATMGITYLDHLYVGGYYSALVSQHYRTDIDLHRGTSLRGSFNHGGIIAGYVLKPQSLVNLNFAVRAGWGSIWYFDPNITNSDKLDELYHDTRDQIFVLTPQVELTITPIQWLRIGVGAGYRIVTGLDKYSNADYDSPVGVLSLSFGSFKAAPALPKDVETNPEP